MSSSRIGDEPLEEVIEDPHVDMVVELMGGVDTPCQFLTRALDGGKVVVDGYVCPTPRSRSVLHLYPIRCLPSASDVEEPMSRPHLRFG